MVRTIDRAERRRKLAEAVWWIIRRDGLDGASVRAVAAEAGLSPGSVRHFFDTQDGLHVFAMEELSRVITERATYAALTGRPAVESAPGPDEPIHGGPTARQRVRAALLELLPVTKETTDFCRAWLQFVVRSSVQPALEPVARNGLDQLQTFYRQLLQLLIEGGHAPADLALDAEADQLAALLDGIVFRRVTVPHLLTVDGAVALVDAFLDRLETESPS